MGLIGFIGVYYRVDGVDRINRVWGLDVVWFMAWGLGFIGFGVHRF